MGFIHVKLRLFFSLCRVGRSVRDSSRLTQPMVAPRTDPDSTPVFSVAIEGGRHELSCLYLGETQSLHYY